MLSGKSYFRTRTKPTAVHALASRGWWIFDLDGTLTRPVHDFAAIRVALGIPAGHMILEYLDALPDDESGPLYRRLDEIERALAERAEPADGMQALLDTLDGAGFQLGVLTRNSRENAINILTALDALRHFDPACILGRDEAPAKPDPGGVHHLLENWRARAKHAVMVGDGRLDLLTGRDAGVLTVHVDRNGVFRWPELADVRVTSLEEVIELV